MPAQLRVVCGDITTLRVDAIVNAANSSLRGGSGVDGAIHRAAGPALLEECAGLGGCPPGEARLTRGYRLPARYVIHTVGPVWHGGTEGEADVLASCYRSVLELAATTDITTLAFPSISTGVYRYPITAAAAVAIASVKDGLYLVPRIHTVTFCCFSESDRAVYATLLGAAGG
ncbi:MAG: O-acetyl-ADP-ribose deacetylase [Gemmatimonadaceae bacterium]|nr:O-acetyl-ADP-ribose deacetylase [Gemmatimonadaceae bacterium]